MEERWKIRSWYGATLSSLGPVRFLENHRHKLCMQVVGIVRPLTSAGPDDKLLHIQIFGANEGTKFEYRSSRFSFSRLSFSLSLFLTNNSSAPFLFFSAILTTYLRPTMILWFDLSNDFSRVRRELAYVEWLSFRHAFDTRTSFSMPEVGQIDETRGS